MNLPVPYDPEFARQQMPLGILFSAPLDEWAEWAWNRLIDPIVGRPMYFDKAGNPITIEQWGELRETDVEPDGSYGPRSYLRVGEDEVGEARVSTVWLGMDHGFGYKPDGRDYRPVIFETMIFGGKYDDYMMRYCTEAEAIKGHAEAVADLRAGMNPWWAYGGQDEDEFEWHSPELDLGDPRPITAPKATGRQVDL